MHSNVTVKNVSWPQFSWATLYIYEIFGVRSAAVSRLNRIRHILARLHCTLYTHNMAGATMNIDNTSK